MQRAYSVLTVKAVDEDKRMISGVATTPETDRAGDIVEPKGAAFKLPMPFLWQHDSKQPIGHVTKAKVTASGIDVEVRLVKIDEPGTLKNRIDEAWQSIKAGLVRGLSIGFTSIESARIDGTFGMRFLKWNWLELSAVTIPANIDATITTIKSIDASVLAATGKQARETRDRSLTPGATGKPSVKLFVPKEGNTVKTLEQQIADWEAKRAAKAARQTEIMTKSAEDGRTLETAEKEEHDTLRDEVKEIDEHLVRLGEMQKTMKTQVVPARGESPEDGTRSRQSHVQVIEPRLDKGIGFARYIKCLAMAQGNIMLAEQIAKSQYPNYAPLHAIMKTAVAAGTTSDTTWAAPLVEYQILANEFIEYLRPQTIIGKFGTGGVPSLRRVPFKIKVPRQTSKGTGYWVGEGKAKPISKFALDSVTLDFYKVAALCVITEELARLSTPSAEALVRDEMAASVVERIDIDFVDPNKILVANVSPASITNGATSIVSSGDTAANIRTDIQALFAEFIQDNIPIADAVWIMNANVALGLSMARNDLGQPEFPGISMVGGNFQKIPVIVSQYVPTALVILVAASEIYLADDGNVSIDVSREASIEMVDSSSQTSTTGTGASLVSMFQTNSVAIRAEREINWTKRRPGAVAYLTSANWGGTAGSGDI